MTIATPQRSNEKLPEPLELSVIARFSPHYYHHLNTRGTSLLNCSIHNLLIYTQTTTMPADTVGKVCFPS
jgi:hypothetical protein